MTGPSQRERDQIRRDLNRTVAPAIRDAFRAAMSGSVRWNQSKIDALMDWIETDLAKSMVFAPGVPDADKKSLWVRFEAFSRARAAGQLDNPEVWAVLFACMRAFADLQGKALDFFEVRFFENPEEGTALPDPDRRALPPPDAA